MNKIEICVVPFCWFSTLPFPCKFLEYWKARKRELFSSVVFVAFNDVFVIDLLLLPS